MSKDFMLNEVQERLLQKMKTVNIKDKNTE